MKKIICAIETSCDETSVAILKDGQLLSNVVASQTLAHQSFGGVVPEIASRLHLENIDRVLAQAMAEAHVTGKDFTHIAVTKGPGLIGALHVGLQAAKTLAALYHIPLIPVHHLAAHIYANAFVKPLTFPLLALVVSGGHTEWIYMKESLSFEIVGHTVDDAMGEAYDKVARLLDLGYPGGPIIDRLAKEGKVTYDLPTPLINDPNHVSFSGLKTAVMNLVNQLKQKKEFIRVADLCASFQEIATSMVVQKTKNLLVKYGVNQLVLGGGVSANDALRTKLKALEVSHKIHVHVPPMWCCTDQAAMIAKLADVMIDANAVGNLSMAADASWSIEKAMVI
jgi:N6-L-threonylcarbamoyladenine synthase